MPTNKVYDVNSINDGRPSTMELWCHHCNEARTGVVVSSSWYCRCCGCSKKLYNIQGEKA